jgi:hypothetical protein
MGHSDRHETLEHRMGLMGAQEWHTSRGGKFDNSIYDGAVEC